MRPSCNPGRVVGVDSEDPDWRMRRKQLLEFCQDMHKKAEVIPYSSVCDDISRKIAEHLTHPTDLREDRWKDVMAKLGYTDQCLIGKVKYHEEWLKGEEAKPAFFLFLTRIYAEDGGNLWKVIDALSEEKYTDVMEEVKSDISKFIETYTPIAESQPISQTALLDTLDSGVGQSLISNGIPLSHQSGGNVNFVGHVASPVRNHDLLINPQKGHIVLDYLESLENKRQENKENLFWPKREPYPDMSFKNDTEDDIFDFSIPFEKSPTAIKVFIPHTQSEEDEEIAEEIATRLKDEYQFSTYLLKNMFCAVNLDIGDFIMKVMENVDFIVPVLSRAYLQEIVPVGNTNEMPNERLVLRYIHAVSQTRVINKNSLNYLIRPIMVDDVNYGMVRKWHEFQSAVKYPKELGRLAKNLKATKEFIIRKKYSRQ